MEYNVILFVYTLYKESIKLIIIYSNPPPYIF